MPAPLQPLSTVEFIADDSVDQALDLELRELLSACFTRPHCRVFQERRYFNEPPAWRWLIRAPSGLLVAHLAAHDKQMFADDGRAWRIGGVAEVCVHPEHRKRGHVGALLAAAHPWMTREGLVFSVLAGDIRYYGTSGYLRVDNLDWDEIDASGARKRAHAKSTLALALTAAPWPAGASLYIPAPPF